MPLVQKLSKSVETGKDVRAYLGCSFCSCNILKWQLSSGLIFVVASNLYEIFLKSCHVSITWIHVTTRVNWDIASFVQAHKFTDDTDNLWYIIYFSCLACVNAGDWWSNLFVSLINTVSMHCCVIWWYAWKNCQLL